MKKQKKENEKAKKQLRPNGTFGRGREIMPPHLVELGNLDMIRAGANGCCAY